MRERTNQNRLTIGVAVVETKAKATKFLHWEGKNNIRRELERR
ncbi:MAG: hypothetical protein N2560_08470 [Ignavibacteria bacterium]|nr:hypothetical protein [Ignavibacteria bacterium]